MTKFNTNTPNCDKKKCDFCRFAKPFFKLTLRFDGFFTMNPMCTVYYSKTPIVDRISIIKALKSAINIPQS
jgi:hypothetical protein